MKEIIKIGVPNTRLRQRIKQANGNNFSRRVVFPANVPKFGSHILLISEDFIKQDPENPENSILFFYSDRDITLTRRVVLESKEVVYPTVKTSAKELKDAVAMKIPQKKQENRLSDEKIEQLKQNISAIDYLKDVYGFTFQRKGNKYFKCDQHDSLVVDASKNAIHWNSENIHGSVIDFIKQVDQKTFLQAIQDINVYFEALPVEKRTFVLPEFEEKEFSLPERAKGHMRVKEYLVEKRAIDEILVDQLIKQGRIYQDTKGNCVFKITDPSGKDVGAFKRSTYSVYKGDEAGSKIAYGFYMELCPGAKKLVLIESFIDTLSYVSLKQNGNEIIDFNILGSDSASLINETFRINYLTRPELNKNLDTIVVATDNDQAGKKAIESFQDFVKPFHYIKNLEVDEPLSKDWNEDLVITREQENIVKEQENFK